MLWQDIRAHYPDQWLLVEALDAHSENDRRVLNRLSVVSTFPDSLAAMLAYKEMHRSDRNRELYVLHTSRENIEINEMWWGGIRANA